MLYWISAIDSRDTSDLMTLEATDLLNSDVRVLGSLDCIINLNAV